MVREYKGSHSGEHGDGLVRSESMSDVRSRIVAEFREGQARFDPDNLLNPARSSIPKMDDRSLFRYRGTIA